VKIPARGSCLAIGLALLVANWCVTPRAEAQGVFDMSATDVTIFVPDTKEVIGHGHYDVSFANGLDVVAGENRYLNGEYDRERQTVRPSAAGLPPVLESYRHQFFNPDGSLQYEDSLDARTGDVACKRYDSAVPDIRETITKIPPDTYAGATQLMLLVGRLRQGAAKITFHSFNCLPDPRIVPIEAIPEKYPVTWPMYPGQLVKLEMKPDFGWLNVVVAPFVPKVYGWFDPTNAFNYVGGEFSRYYKGRQVLMARTHDSNPVTQGPSSTPPAQ
jgi:hypothetical protein